MKCPPPSLWHYQTTQSPLARLKIRKSEKIENLDRQVENYELSNFFKLHFLANSIMYPKTISKCEWDLFICGNFILPKFPLFCYVYIHRCILLLPNWRILYTYTTGIINYDYMYYFPSIQTNCSGYTLLFVICGIPAVKGTIYIHFIFHFHLSKLIFLTLQNYYIQGNGIPDGGKFPLYAFSFLHFATSYSEVILVAFAAFA